ncbi:hypothetical protein JJV70_11655 [Streptomyces sp. JJ66]|uniref:DUF6479 family protein n=1 Tax=Streptomyces sp. JJ66 TaxID=2803843 RepID=UPI001C58CA1D|nr:DUF6479 family protein [Streptomyces sp. JJ66]MBW1602752.1 hypothetical protein [Streptomyces sp. JJ66]
MRDLLVGIAPFAAGIVVAAVLAFAVVYGIRRLRSTGISRPPARHQPAPGEVEETGHEREYREPDEMPRDGRRRLPHEMPGGGTATTRRGAWRERPRWSEGTRGGDTPKGGE